MAHVSDKAIVIRVWDWSETSQTVSLFSREHGLIKGVAKGAKRERSKFSGGLDLLTLGALVAIIKPSGAMANLIEWDLERTFFRLRADLRAHYAAMYLADLVQQFLSEADPSPPLFDALLQALADLDTAVDPAGVALRFQWAVVSLTGHEPRLDRPAQGAEAAFGFDPGLGRLVEDPGESATLALPWRVRRETVDLLDALAGASALRPGAEPPRLAAPPPTIRRANRLMAAYIRWLLGREPPTLRTMDAVFGPPAPPGADPSAEPR